MTERRRYEAASLGNNRVPTLFLSLIEICGEPHWDTGLGKGFVFGVEPRLGCRDARVILKPPAGDLEILRGCQHVLHPCEETDTRRFKWKSNGAHNNDNSVHNSFLCHNN